MVMTKSLAVGITTLSVLLLVITPLAQVAAVPISLDHHRPGHGGGPGGPGDPGGDDGKEEIIVVNREGGKARWKFKVSPTGVGEFVSGPTDNPPLGKGSVHLSVTEITPGGQAAELGNFKHSKTKLVDLTSLRYCTYMTETGANGLLFPYIILNIDRDADGSSDNLVFFEPLYQDNFDPTLNEWNCWDALNGSWWGNCGPIIVNPGGTEKAPKSCVKPLLEHFSGFPNAQILNFSVDQGAIRILVGLTGSAATYDGNVDAFTIGVKNKKITYDFEPPK